MNITGKKSVSVIEKAIIVLIVTLGALALFTLSAHANVGQVNAKASAKTTAEPQAPVMGPAAPTAAPVDRVTNAVEIPTEMVGVADCFNVYRNNVLIGDCVKPRIDPADGNYYFDDSSAEVTPASRWTYEIAAVNATGESPRVNQGGPYPSTK